MDTTGIGSFKIDTILVPIIMIMIMIFMIMIVIIRIIPILLPLKKFTKVILI